MKSVSETDRWQAPSDAAPLRGRLWWLLGIVAVGLALRVYRLSWGLPDFIPPDSLNYYIRPAARLVAAGEVVPPAFIHTPLFVYTIGAVVFAWSQLWGGPIDLDTRALQEGTRGILPGAGSGVLGSQDFPPQLTDLILTARGFCVFIAILSIIALYSFARRMFGDRAALFASAVLALGPLHVLESHRVNADGLMILLVILTAHRTAAAMRKGSWRGVLGGFALAGLTGAIRYNGLAIGSLPAWAALRWPDARPSERTRKLLLGSAVSLAVVAIGLLPALFAWEQFRKEADLTMSFGFLAGGNYDLSGKGWVFHRYVYQLFVTFPFSLGWPAYLCSLAGLALLAKSDKPALRFILAATLPFFLIQGAARTVEHRYFQLLLPFMALTAGVALAALARSRKTGAALAVAILAYTAALSASHCLRLGFGPQRAIANLLHEQALHAKAAGRTLGVGYPSAIDLLVDPLRTQIREPAWQLRYVPHILDEDDAAESDSELRARLETDLRRWAVEKDVDLIVLPSWQEAIALRTKNPRMRSAAFVYQLLEAGAIGFRPIAHLRDPFFTESLYTWADPLVESHRVTGILGYKVFARMRDEPTSGANMHHLPGGD